MLSYYDLVNRHFEVKNAVSEKQAKYAADELRKKVKIELTKYYNVNTDELRATEEQLEQFIAIVKFIEENVSAREIIDAIDLKDITLKHADEIKSYLNRI